MILVTLILPVFVMPNASDPWETQKVLVGLGLLSLAWIWTWIGMIRRGQHRWEWKRFDIFVGAILVVAGLSLAFAIDIWTGLRGLNGSLAQTVPVILGFGSFWWLLRLHFSEPSLRWWPILGLGLGLTLALWLQIWQLSNFTWWPQIWPSNQFFGVISSAPLDTAAVAAVVGAGWLIFWDRLKERWQRWTAVAGLTVSWLVLLFLQQPLAWAMFAIGMIAVVLQQTAKKKPQSSNILLAAVGLAALGMVVQFIHISSIADVPQPIDLRLDQSTTVATTVNTWKARPVLGTGPNSWYQAFVHYRPTSFSQSDFWSTRFIKGRSAWFDLGASQGWLGLIVWMGALLTAMVWLWRRWRQTAHPLDMLALLVVSLTVLAGWLMTWSLVWLLMLVTFLGVSAAGADRLPKPKTFSSGGWVAAIVTVIGLIAFWIPAVRIYATTWSVQNAQNQITHQASLDQVKKTLIPAHARDMHNLDAAELLARIYASQAVQAAQAGQTDQAKNLVQQAIQTLQPTVDRNTTNPVAYESMNNLLNIINPLTVDAEVEARKNFEALRRLEPANPIHDVGYGQTLLASRTRLLAQDNLTADQQAQADQMLTQADQAFQAALTKRPVYVQAALGSAQVLIAQEKYDQAKTWLDKYANLAKTSGAYWRLVGLTESGLHNEAGYRDAFQKAIDIDATDLNAYVGWSQAEKSHGHLDQAKQVITRGQAAVPNSAILQAALDDLQS